MMLAISIWVFFMLGQLTHGWLRASVVVNSKLNGIGTYSRYISIHAPVIAIRFFAAALGLMWWGWHPDTFTTLAKTFHWDVQMSIPLNPATAGAYGIFADALIDLAAAKFAFLQKEIPPVGGVISTSKEVATTETVTETTTVTVPADPAATAVKDGGN